MNRRAFLLSLPILVGLSAIKPAPATTLDHGALMAACRSVKRVPLSAHYCWESFDGEMGVSWNAPWDHVDVGEVVSMGGINGRITWKHSLF